MASYQYSGDSPHAVSAVTRVGQNPGTNTYTYDQNGNMTCRVENGKTYNQVYNAENRFVLAQLMNTGISCPAANTVAPLANVTASWAFAYDGDGARVKQVYTTYVAPITLITNYYFFGGVYEVETNGATTTHYNKILRHWRSDSCDV